MRIVLSKTEWEVYMREIGAQIGKPDSDHTVAPSLVPMISRVLVDFGVKIEKANNA